MEDKPIMKAITAMEVVEKHSPVLVNVSLIETQKAIAYALIEIAETLEDIKRHGLSVSNL